MIMIYLPRKFPILLCMEAKLLMRVRLCVRLYRNMSYCHQCHSQDGRTFHLNSQNKSTNPIIESSTESTMWLWLVILRVEALHDLDAAVPCDISNTISLLKLSIMLFKERGQLGSDEAIYPEAKNRHHPLLQQNYIVLESIDSFHSNTIMVCLILRLVSHVAASGTRHALPQSSESIMTGFTPFANTGMEPWNARTRKVSRNREQIGKVWRHFHLT